MEEKTLITEATPQQPSVDVRNSEPTYTSDYSLSLVCDTWWAYSSWRKGNIEPRWVDADSLYFGNVRQRTWPGTAIPRASYAQPIVFDQVESLMPLLEQAIFPDSEDWFEILPNFALQNPQTGEDMAPKLGRLLTANLKAMVEGSEQIGYPSGRREIINAIKQSLLYKLGGIHIRWSALKKHPVIECVDIRDVFFDPKSLGPSPELGKSMIWRKLMRVRDLMAYRDDPDFNIPPDDQLYWLAMNAPGDSPDTSKTLLYALMRQGVNAGPTQYEPNILDREIEVLMYYNRDRIIWTLNKLHTALNIPNRHGWFPFSFAPCYEVPNACYGLSVAEVQEGPQRLIEGLFNLHLDELALNLQPPRIEGQQSQHDNGDAWGPGVKFKVRSPKDDLIFQQPGGLTVNVLDTIGFVQGGSYSRTGLNPLQQGGIPTPSNANRTASGMGMQMTGGNNRVYSMVKRYEDYLISDALYKMVEMLRVHLVEGEEVDGVNEYGQIAKLNPAIWHVPLKIEVKGASRVISKDKLLQLVPNFIQYFGQGTMLQALHQVGQTLDIHEIESAMMEATGLGKRYSFFRPLTQPEIEQMKQQATPKPDPNQQMKAEATYKTRIDAEQIKAQASLQKAQIAAQPNPFEIELEKAKADMEMQLKAMDMQIKQMDLQIKQRSAELDLMAQQGKMRLDAEKAQMDAQNQRVKSAMEMEQADQTHQMNLFQQAASADQQRQLAAKQAAAEPEEESD